MSSALIADSLIADIRAGRFPVDQPLPAERDLCERYGSSRSTVREALQQLQVRGYATREIGHRPRASLPSIDGIFATTASQFRELLGDDMAGFHLEQLRQFIEVGAVVAACQDTSVARLTQIHAALLRCHEAIGDETAFIDADIAFHRAIVEAVGNPILLALHDRFVRSMLASRPQVPDRLEHDRLIYAEHRALYEAIASHDIGIAVRVMDEHLARSARSRLVVPPPPEAPRSTHLNQGENT
ncbi:MAG: FCD domain-containing protein [Granulosicoccus sp.]